MALAEERLLAELEAITDDLAGLTEAEYADPTQFADSLVNHIPTIRYALGSGMPVTAWGAAVKNASEADRVLRAVRQWEEMSRRLLAQLASGDINLDTFRDLLGQAFKRQARNSYVAGRRAIGDLSPLTVSELEAIDEMTLDDEQRLTSYLTNEPVAGGVSSLLLSMFLDPTNYLGSGLPGDPWKEWPAPLGAGVKSPEKMATEALRDLAKGKAVPEAKVAAALKAQTRLLAAGKPVPDSVAKLAATALRGRSPGIEAAKELAAYQNRIGQYGDAIRSYSNAGELSALTKALPGASTLVWWTLGPADHCIDCVRLSDASPFYGDMLATNGVFPGSGHTKCGGRCRCRLEYDVPTEVCTDPMSGPGSLGDLGITESADGQRINVWVQESTTCQNPVSITSLADSLGLPDAIDDGDAFVWDEDVANAIKGRLDESVPLGALSSTEVAVRAAVRRVAGSHRDEFARITERMREHVPGNIEDVRLSRYEADGSVFHVWWQEFNGAVRLEMAATTDGLPVLEADFLLRVLSDLAERAERQAMRLEVNAEMASDGLKRWLSLLGAERASVGGLPPSVVPDFAQQAKLATRRLGVEDAWLERTYRPRAGIAPEPALPWPEMASPHRYVRKAPPGAPGPGHLTDAARALYASAGTKEQLAAFRKYRRMGFHDVNRHLRGKETDYRNLGKEGTQAVIAQLDALTNAVPLPEETFVYRSLTGLESFDRPDLVGLGLNDRALLPEAKAALDGMVGRTFTDNGFMSTSVDQIWPYPVEMQLRVPEGTPGFFAGARKQFTGEQELLLGRGLAYRIDEVFERTIIDGGKSETQVVVRASIVRPKAGIAPTPEPRGVDMLNGRNVAEMAPRADTMLPEVAKAVGKTPDEVVASLQAAVDKMAAEGIVETRLTPTKLQGILDDGRFRTSFEGTKGTIGPKHISDGGGWEQVKVAKPETRAPTEERLFGYSPAIPLKYRPVYGYLSSADIGAGGDVPDYGTVVLRLKAAVKQRTTITEGDSLNWMGGGIRAVPAHPTNLSDPSWRGLTTQWPRPEDRGGFQKFVDDQLADIAKAPDLHLNPTVGLSPSGFIEAQIHGGVTVADIAEVVFTKAAPGKPLRASLEAAGIPWRVVKEGSAFGPLPEGQVARTLDEVFPDGPRISGKAAFDAAIPPVEPGPKPGLEQARETAKGIGPAAPEPGPDDYNYRPPEHAWFTWDERLKFFDEFQNPGAYGEHEYIGLGYGPPDSVLMFNRGHRGYGAQDRMGFVLYDEQGRAKAFMEYGGGGNYGNPTNGFDAMEVRPVGTPDSPSMPSAAEVQAMRMRILDYAQDHTDINVFDWLKAPPPSKGRGYNDYFYTFEDGPEAALAWLAHRGAPDFVPEPLVPFEWGMPKPKAGVAPTPEVAVPLSQATQAEVEAAARRALVDVADEQGFEVDDLVAAMQDAAARRVRAAHVEVRVQPSALEGILDKGRFQTMWERGALDKPYRRQRGDAERRYFGLTADTPPTSRPVYGYVIRPDDVQPNLDHYGRTVVRLKPEVNARATFSDTDTFQLGPHAAPSRMTDPKWTSMGDAIKPEAKELDLRLDAIYAEAQVHGGVRVSDIAEVVFLSPPAPSTSLTARLTDLGIPWRSVEAPKQWRDVDAVSIGALPYEPKAGIAPSMQRVTKGVTASEKYGVIPITHDFVKSDTIGKYVRVEKPVPITTKTVYHVTTADAVPGIIANGFKLSKVNPRWGNDYAVSATRGSVKKAREYFMGRGATEMKGNRVVLELKVRGRFLQGDSDSDVIDTIAGISSGGPQGYTSRMVQAGVDGIDFGPTYIYNPDAIISIKPVGPEAEKLFGVNPGVAPEVALIPSAPTADELTDMWPSTKDLGGAQDKEVLRADNGDEWLIKPGRQPEALDVVEFGDAMGLRVVPITEVTWNLEPATAQFVVPGQSVARRSTKIDEGEATRDVLSDPTHVDELVGQQILDYLSVNYDNHWGNLVIDDLGRMWGIDKATFDLGSPDWTVKAAIENLFDPISQALRKTWALEYVQPHHFGKWLDALEQVDLNAHLLRLQPGERARFIRRVQAARADYTDWMADYIEHRIAQGTDIGPEWRAWFDGDRVFPSTAKAGPVPSPAPDPSLRSFMPKEVDALPGWPDGGRLKPDPSVTLPGQSPKQVLIDPDGNQWLFKSKNAEAGSVAADVAHALGLRTPPVRMVEWDGQAGSLQPFVPAESFSQRVDAFMAVPDSPDLGDYEYAVFDLLKEMDDGQMVELAQQAVLDTLIANQDGHVGQWLFDESGRLWGIDKDLGFVGAVAVSGNPATMYRNSDHVFSFASERWFRSGLLKKVLPGDIADVLDRLDALSDEAYARMVAPVVPSVASPFATDEQRLAALLKRKHEAREGWSAFYRDMLAKAEPSEYDPGWSAWLKAGGTFVPPASVPVPMGRPLVAAKAMPQAVQLPSFYASSAKAASEVGNDLGVWHFGFIPASLRAEALDRVNDLLVGTKGNRLDGFTLGQLNTILDRLEVMRDAGFDLSLVGRLSDFSEVPPEDMALGIGLTYGNRIALRHDHQWAFLNGVDSPATVYNDIGGLFAHEYGHALYSSLGSEAQADVIRLWERVKAAAKADLSDYAATDPEEWWGEVIAAITTPGYQPGTLAYDREVWTLLATSAEPIPAPSLWDKLPIPSKKVEVFVEPPPLRRSIANGPYGDVTEMMPVSALMKYREYDRHILPTDPDYIDIKKNGIKTPLELEVSVKDGTALLTEGNHRLAIARALGMEWVPVRGVRRNGAFMPEMAAKAKPVKVVTDSTGYLPADLPPSAFAPTSDFLIPVKDAPTEPIGPPLSEPKRPYFKPGNAQQYIVGGSDLPLNAPLVDWTGYVPPEPPIPTSMLKRPKEEVEAARKAHDAAFKDWKDVQSGRVSVAFAWNKGESDAAAKAGFTVDKVGDQYMVGKDSASLDALRAYIADGGDTRDDAFWHLAGYSVEDLAAIDGYEAAKGGLRLTGGVILVEPDGRLWLLAPKNEWAGYQNTHIKGGVDGGESAAEAAVREMREEAGFSAELDGYLGDYVNADRTGVSRFYIGHRTGGGPLWAHQKETYEVRLVTAEEAKGLLTRYKKPEERDQRILADAVAALQGKDPLAEFVIPAESVADFAAKTAPLEQADVWFPEPKTGWHVKAGVAPDPPVSTAFGYDYNAMKGYSLGPITPPSPKFPMYQARVKLPDGTSQPFYWKTEGVVPTYTSAEVKAVDDWSADAAFAVSDVLRNGAPSDPATDAIIAGLDSAIAKAPGIADVTLYRGLGGPAPWGAGNLPGIGDVWVDKSFSATTTDIGVAANYGSVILRVQPSDGLRGVDIKVALGAKEDVSKEILLERGVRFEVVGIEHADVTALDLANLGMGPEDLTDNLAIVTVKASPAGLSDTGAIDDAIAAVKSFVPGGSLDEDDFYAVADMVPATGEPGRMKMFAFDAHDSPSGSPMNVYVAYADDGNIATVQATYDDEGVPFFFLIATSPEYQHGGYATKLLDWMQATGHDPVGYIANTAGFTPSGKAFALKWLAHQKSLAVTDIAAHPQAPPLHLVWNNSKKQVADPHLRFTLHVNHLLTIAEQVSGDVTLHSVRVQETLLAQVPKLREMLIAGGAKPLGKQVEIGRSELLALAKAITDNTPLAASTPHIPTAPMNVTPKVVGGSGLSDNVIYDAMTMSSIKGNYSSTQPGNVTEWLLPGKAAAVETTWEAQTKGKLLRISLPDPDAVLSEEQYKALVAATLAHHAGVAAVTGSETIALTATWTSGPGKRAQWLAEMVPHTGGGVTVTGNGLVLSAAEVAAYANKVQGQIGSTDLLDPLIWPWVTGVATKAPKPSGLATGLYSAADAALINLNPLEQAATSPGLGQTYMWSATSSFIGTSYDVDWRRLGNTLRLNKVQVSGSPLTSEKHAAVAKALAQAVDLMDLTPATDNGIYITEQVAKTAPHLIERLVTDYGATFVGGDYSMTREQAHLFRDIFFAESPVPTSTFTGALNDYVDLLVVDNLFPDSVMSHVPVGIDILDKEWTNRIRRYYVEGKATLDWHTSTAAGGNVQAIENDIVVLRNLVMTTEGDATVDALVISATLDAETRAFLLARGASIKADRVYLDRATLLALGPELEPTPIAATAAVGYNPVGVVNAPHSADYDPMMALATAVDVKLTYAPGAGWGSDLPGAAPMTQTTFQTGKAAGPDSVTWRRLGNVLEAHAITAKSGAFADASLSAFIMRMGKVADNAPKVSAIRFATSTTSIPTPGATTLTATQRTLLLMAGGKEYAGGIKLTRDQLLTLRDQLVVIANSQPATLAAPSPAAAITYDPAQVSKNAHALSTGLSDVGLDGKPTHWMPNGVEFGWTQGGPESHAHIHAINVSSAAGPTPLDKTLAALSAWTMGKWVAIGDTVTLTFDKEALDAVPGLRKVLRDAGAEQLGDGVRLQNANDLINALYGGTTIAAVAPVAPTTLALPTKVPSLKYSKAAVKATEFTDSKMLDLTSDVTPEQVAAWTQTPVYPGTGMEALVDVVGDYPILERFRGMQAIVGWNLRKAKNYPGFDWKLAEPDWEDVFVVRGVWGPSDEIQEALFRDWATRAKEVLDPDNNITMTPVLIDANAIKWSPQLQALKPYASSVAPDGSLRFDVDQTLAIGKALVEGKPLPRTGVTVATPPPPVVVATPIHDKLVSGGVGPTKELVATITPQKQGFVKVEYEHPMWTGGAVTQRTRYLKSDAVWTSTGGNGDPLSRTHASLRHILTIGDHLDNHSAVTGVRFEQTMSTQFSELLQQYGATYSPDYKAWYMERTAFLKLRDDIASEIAVMGNVAALQAAPTTGPALTLVEEMGLPDATVASVIDGGYISGTTPSAYVWENGITTYELVEQDGTFLTGAMGGDPQAEAAALLAHLALLGTQGNTVYITANAAGQMPGLLPALQNAGIVTGLSTGLTATEAKSVSDAIVMGKALPWMGAPGTTPTYVPPSDPWSFSSQFGITWDEVVNTSGPKPEWQNVSDVWEPQLGDGETLSIVLVNDPSNTTVLVVVPKAENTITPKHQQVALLALINEWPPSQKYGGGTLSIFADSLDPTTGDLLKAAGGVKKFYNSASVIELDAPHANGLLASLIGDTAITPVVSGSAANPAMLPPVHDPWTAMATDPSKGAAIVQVGYWDPLHGPPDGTSGIAFSISSGADGITWHDTTSASYGFLEPEYGAALLAQVHALSAYHDHLGLVGGLTVNISNTPAKFDALLKMYGATPSTAGITSYLHLDPAQMHKMAEDIASNAAVVPPAPAFAPTMLADSLFSDPGNVAGIGHQKTWYTANGDTIAAGNWHVAPYAVVLDELTGVYPATEADAAAFLLDLANYAHGQDIGLVMWQSEVLSLPPNAKDMIAQFATKTGFEWRIAAADMEAFRTALVGGQAPVMYAKATKPIPLDILPGAGLSNEPPFMGSMAAVYSKDYTNGIGNSATLDIEYASDPLGPPGVLIRAAVGFVGDDDALKAVEDVADWAASLQRPLWVSDAATAHLSTQNSLTALFNKHGQLNVAGTGGSGYYIGTLEMPAFLADLKALLAPTPVAAPPAAGLFGVTPWHVSTMGEPVETAMAQGFVKYEWGGTGVASVKFRASATTLTLSKVIAATDGDAASDLVVHNAVLLDMVRKWGARIDATPSITSVRMAYDQMTDEFRDLAAAYGASAAGTATTPALTMTRDQFLAMRDHVADAFGGASVAGIPAGAVNVQAPIVTGTATTPWHHQQGWHIGQMDKWEDSGGFDHGGVGSWYQGTDANTYVKGPNPDYDPNLPTWQANGKEFIQYTAVWKHNAKQVVWQDVGKGWQKVISDNDRADPAIWKLLAHIAGTAKGDGSPLFVSDYILDKAEALKKSLLSVGAKPKYYAHYGDGLILTTKQIDDLLALMDNALSPQPGFVAPVPPVATAVPPPAAVPTPVAPVAPPPKPVDLGDLYGYDHAKVSGWGKGVDEVANDTPITRTVVSTYPDTSTVTWAEEAQGKARIVRIRKATGPTNDTTGALVAQLKAFGTSGNYTTLNGGYTKGVPERLLIDKKALATAPGLSQMLTASGAWKQTKDYWVIGSAELAAFADELTAGKALWMPSAPVAPSVIAVPPPTAAPIGAVAGSITGPTTAPAKVTPAFLYGYDPAKVAQPPSHGGNATIEVKVANGMEQQDKQIWQVGTVKGYWSVSPTGGRSGLFAIDAGGASAEEVRDAAFSMLRVVAEQAPQPKGFFVKPEFYDAVPGLRQLILDAGGVESDYPAIGAAVSLAGDAATKLAKALETNTMGPISPGFKTTADYLGYQDITAKALMTSQPTGTKGGLVWQVDTGASKKVATTVLVEGSSDWGKALIRDFGTGGTTVTNPLVFVAQINWLAEQGAREISVAAPVLAKVPAIRQWLLSVGGKVDGAVIRLDEDAVSMARRTITKDALPAALGGTPLPYSVLDELNANVDSVAVALTNHVVQTGGVTKVSRFNLNGVLTNTAYSESDKNIHWLRLDRGTGSVGDARATAAAQLRVFANHVAQHAGVERLDIAVDVVDQLSGMRAVLRKYGATLERTKGEEYWSLSRSAALKMRADLEAEWSAFDSLTGLNVLEQKAGVISWPSVEELTFDTAKSGSLAGQSRKGVYVDTNGNEWLFKPGRSGRGAVTDVAAVELGKMLGLPIPPSRIYSLQFNGKLVEGSLQKMVPGAIRKNTAQLSDAEMEQVLRHSVLDWVMNNDDAHIQNWVIDADGTVWAIDKTRAYKAWKGPNDVLDATSLGQGGTPAMAPTLFSFFLRARQDPSVLKAIHPTSITPTLRKLQRISDDDFMRLMRPVAERTEHPAYIGNPEKLLKEMVERKNSAAADLEAFIRGEIQRATRTDPKAVPKDWSDWLARGGQFNLNATPQDLMEEHFAALSSKFGDATSRQPGGFTPARYKALLQSSQIDAAAAVMSQFIDGGLRSLSPGQSIGGSYVGFSAHTNVTPEMLARTKGVPAEGSYAPNYIPLLAPQQQYETWLELQQWALLSIAHGAAGPKGASYDAMLRSMWDPEQATFFVNRGSGRFNTTKQAFDDLVKSNGKLAKSYGSFANSWGGLRTYARFHYTQFITTDATDITRGEHEWIARDIRPDQVIRITTGHKMTRAELEAWERAHKNPWD